MRYPALIFDFGNVLAHFDYRRTYESLGRRLGISGEDFLEHGRARGLAELVRAYESGRITSDAFSERARRDLGLEIAHEDFASAWSDIFTLNEPVARLIVELKARGYTLVLGSNTNDLHAARFRRQFAEPLACFDRLVLSYELGHTKPSPEFYLACAEAAGAPPGACVFIDDMPENVDGARAAGLQAVLYRDDPTLRDDLRRLDVAIADE